MKRQFGRFVKFVALSVAIGSTALALRSSQSQSTGLGYVNPIEASCHSVLFDGSHFIVCKYDPSRQTIQLRLTDKYGQVLHDFGRLSQTLGSASRQVVFAMNAGMYGLDGQPIGLYIENGRQRRAINRGSGSGNFYMKPNGILWSDGSATHINDTDSFEAESKSRVQWATQSGPMLILAGQINPKIAVDGASHYIRNGVCTDTLGKTYFVISDDPVSFGKLARLFHDQLHCQTALYLDGYVSSLWDGGTGRNDQAINIGPMIVVMQKP